MFLKKRVDGYYECMYNSHCCWAKSQQRLFKTVKFKYLFPVVQAKWRVVRVVEGARLESVCTGNCTESSNLSLSAIFLSKNKCFLRSDCSVLVSRKAISWTSSGSEDSSDKWIVACAVRVPGDCGPTLKRRERAAMSCLFLCSDLLNNW